MWLDEKKHLLLWGKSRGAATILSSHVPLMEILYVSTSQHVEYDDETARVFYMLKIVTVSRELQLGTELKEKLNLWFDALNNCVLYFRVRGQLPEYNPEEDQL